jgi:hypothetical protein
MRVRPIGPVAVAAALLAVAVPCAPTALAKGPAFAVKPITERPYFVYRAEPGGTVSGRLRVVNRGDAPGVVRLYAVDGTTGQTTGAVYGSSPGGARGVGAWTRLSAARLRLAPGQRRTVSFRVRVPRRMRDGEHLGAIVADGGVRPGRRRRHGGSSFGIDVRTLVAVAVKVTLPGPRRPALAVDGVRPGGARGYQQLLVGLANPGNVLVKGRGLMRVRDAAGRPVKRLRFRVDTFVPRTRIALPLAVEGKALPAGRYVARVNLRFHGRKVSKTFAFTVDDRALAQVFGARPPTRIDAASRSPLVLLAVGALLLALGFGGGWLVVRRRTTTAPPPAHDAPADEVEDLPRAA